MAMTPSNGRPDPPRTKEGAAVPAAEAKGPGEAVRAVVIPAHGVRPLVSVVIPAYNAERFIGRTLDSLLAQTYPNFEAIVVDDGSTDTTAAIVEEFARRDRRIRLHRQQQGGASRARNAAIGLARGPLVAPLDADDVWTETKLADEVAAMAASGPEVGLVYSWSRIIDEEERPVAEIAHTKNGDVLAELASTNFIGNGSAPMMRTDLVRKLGGYSTELQDRCEDWDLYLRIAEGHEFRCVPRVCVGYRQGLGGLSADYRKMEHGFRVMRRRLRERRPDLPHSLSRTSASLFFFYLAQKSAVQGHYGRTLRYLLTTLLEDPMRIISRQYYGELGKWLIRVVSLPVTRYLWSDQRRWGQLRRSVARAFARDPAAAGWHHEAAPEVAVRLGGYDALMNRRLEAWKKAFTMRYAPVRAEPQVPAGRVAAL